MKIASVDIGSNTILLLIGEMKNDKFKEILTISKIAGLGKGIDKSGEFSKQSMEDAYKILSEYRSKVVEAGLKPEDVIMTATEASRVARNASDFYHKIAKELGFSCHIITAKAEGYFTALGVSGDLEELSKDEVVIMDIGGASTELIKAQRDPFDVIKSISFPVGSVRASDWQAQKIYEQKIKEVVNPEQTTFYKADFLLCVAGSMTSMAAMVKGLKAFDADKINGQDINVNDLLNLKQDLRDLDPAAILAEYPFLEKRSTTIKAAIDVAIYFSSLLNVKKLRISTFGLRYGTIYDYYNKKLFDKKIKVDSKFLA